MSTRLSRRCRPNTYHNRKSSPYFEPHRNKHDVPHFLHNILVILDDDLDAHHSKVAADCVLFLFRRIFINKLLNINLIRHEDVQIPHNRYCTIYYETPNDKPQGVFVNIRAENVRVLVHHERIHMLFDERDHWMMNLLFIPKQVASLISSEAYWFVFQRVINDTIYDLKRQIFQADDVIAHQAEHRRMQMRMRKPLYLMHVIGRDELTGATLVEVRERVTPFQIFAAQVQVQRHAGRIDCESRVWLVHHAFPDMYRVLAVRDGGRIRGVRQDLARGVVDVR